jgi:hypothetical protein
MHGSPLDGTSVCEEAEAIIESSNLSAIEHLTLLSFTDNAVDQETVARYILGRVSEGIDSNIASEDTLRAIKEDLTTVGRRRMYRITILRSLRTRLFRYV